MSSGDDRQAYQASASARERPDYRCDLNRRSGKTCHFLPERSHRALGELYFRRVQRVAVGGLADADWPRSTLATASLQPAATATTLFCRRRSFARRVLLVSNRRTASCVKPTERFRR